MWWSALATVPLLLGMEPTPSPVQARLVYDAGALARRCPTAEDVEDAVSARLGYVPWQAGAPQTVVLKIREARPGLEAHLNFVDAQGRSSGRRVLSVKNGDCRELVDTATLSITVTLDPMVLARTPQTGTPTPPPVPHKPPDPAPAPAPPKAAHNTAPPPAASAPSTSGKEDPLWKFLRGQLAPRLLTSARVTANLGSQPAPTLGPGMDLWIGLGPVTAVLDARGFIPTGGRGSTGAFYLGHAWLQGGLCVDRVVVAACPMFGVGGVAARGEGGWTVAQPFTWTASLGVRGVARVPLWGPLLLTLTGDANLALRRVLLRRAQDAATLWAAPPVFAELGVGLAWSAP